MLVDGCTGCRLVLMCSGSDTVVFGLVKRTRLTITMTDFNAGRAALARPLSVTYVQRKAGRTTRKALSLVSLTSVRAGRDIGSPIRPALSTTCHSEMVGPIP